MIKINEQYQYILAVSGGADSMALLDIFCHHTPHINFEVVTIDHQLRKDSQDDCQLVARYCQQHDIVCHIEQVDVLSYCKTNKVSIETGARTLRHKALDSYQCDYIVLAHNSDDSVESIIMNMARGSGTAGMQGIKEYNGKLYRPLLVFTKEQLTQYCIDNNVPYCIDSTNDDTNYTRNYVRHQVIPILNGINSSSSAHLLQLSALVAQDNEYIDSTIDYSVVKVAEDRVTIDSSHLTQHRAVATRLIRHAINSLVGSTTDFSMRNYNDIIELASNVGGKKLCLPFDILAYNDYNKVTIMVGAKEEVANIELPFQVGSHITPCGVLVVDNTKPNECDNCLRFNIEAIPPTAVIRNIRQGDTIAKFGGGTKSVNRYLMDKKIPARDRERLLVVAEDNNVLIIVGVEIASSVAVTDSAHYIYLQRS